MSTPPNRSRPLPVPRSRIARLARLGGMASVIMGGMALDGARQVTQGRRPELRDLLLTPANISRVTDQLARMRGAAMKVGQLISMDAGEVLSPELADILARLRAEADHMPPRQLRTVLNANWGPDWMRQFARFDVRPIAAASIGQVHRAQTRDGRDVAIKVQYPGVRDSIDSDVSNVGALIRMAGVLPPGFEMAPFLDEARRQLHEEADYLAEARQLLRFRQLLSGAPAFTLPNLHEDLTTRDVLAMSYVPGRPIESLHEAPQAERDRVVALLIDLVFRELFEFRLMQTDPNFANFRHDADTGQIVLLDFGAAREFPDALVGHYRDLARAGLSGDATALRDAARTIGFFDEVTLPRHQDALLDMMTLAFSVLRRGGVFDFSDTDVVDDLRAAGMALGMDRDFTHVPPMDTLYLQRKIGGIYLLAARLRARVDIASLLAPYLDTPALPRSKAS